MDLRPKNYLITLFRAVWTDPISNDSSSAGAVDDILLAIC
jgi:hypothetical protein